MLKYPRFRCEAIPVHLAVLSASDNIRKEPWFPGAGFHRICIRRTSEPSSPMILNSEPGIGSPEEIAFDLVLASAGKMVAGEDVSSQSIHGTKRCMPSQL